MALAAVDRLVHHATIFKMNVESYRRRSAIEANRARVRPASYATIKTPLKLSRSVSSRMSLYNAPVSPHAGLAHRKQAVWHDRWHDPIQTRRGRCF